MRVDLIHSISRVYMYRTNKFWFFNNFNICLISFTSSLACDLRKLWTEKTFSWLPFDNALQYSWHSSKQITPFLANCSAYTFVNSALPGPMWERRWEYIFPKEIRDQISKWEMIHRHILEQNRRGPWFQTSLYPFPISIEPDESRLDTDKAGSLFWC